MQKSTKKELKKEITKKQKNIGYFLPIIFIIIIIPLISYGKIIELPIEEANFWKGGIVHIDFFNYYKSIFLICATIASILAYGGLFLNDKLPLQKENRYYIPMLIYLIMTVTSTIMSHNKHVSIVGFVEMSQGIFVLLSYIVLLFILINYIRDERDVNIIVNSFIILVILEGTFGLCQYFGFDFFKTSLGQWLISPPDIKGESLGFTFDKYTIYGTMYNTNFVGSFGALVLPLMVALYLSESDNKKTILFGGTALLAFATWLGCNSRAGYLGMTVTFIVSLAVFRRVFVIKYKKILTLFCGFILIAFIFNNVSNGRVLNQFSRLSPVNEAEKMQDINEQQQVIFEEVSIEENILTIKTNKETLIGMVNDNILNFYDEYSNKLGVSNKETGIISFVDKKYSEYNFTLYEDQPSYIKAEIYGRRLDLYVTEEQKIKIISFNNKLTTPVEAPRIKLFDGKETFASNRGYVWSRTIPMLKNTLILGYGPDNYPMVFPQEDYVGRFNVGNSGMLDIIIDKPHNMYLQTAVNTGIISLLALMTIWVIYLIDCLKIYINRNIVSFIEYIGAAVFLSITAYLVAGIFNDNVVSVAPLFWVLLGMGIGINRMIALEQGD